MKTLLPWLSSELSLEKLSSESKKLLLTKAFTDLGLALGTSFLNLLIWKVSGDLKLVLLFNLMLHIFMCVAYSIPGFFIKVRKSVLLQISGLAFVFMFALSAFLKSGDIKSVLIIGALYGLAEGFFWFANNLLIYQNTCDSNRDTFFAFDSAIGNTILVASPVLQSLVFFASINSKYFSLQNSYSALFVLSLLAFTMSFILASRLKSDVVSNLSVGECFKTFKDKLWGLVYIREFIDGLRDGSESFVASLILFFILKSEFGMSAFNVVFSLISVIIALVLSSILKRKNRLFFGSIGAVLLLLSRIVFIKLFSLNGLIISSVIDSFALPMFSVGLVSTFFDAVDRSSVGKVESTTYIFTREIPLTLGRVFGVLAIFFFAGFKDNITVLKCSFLMLGIIPLLYLSITYLFEKCLDKNRIGAGDGI